MTESSNISLHTYIGNCCEEVAALAIERLSLDFQRSPVSPKGLISPDFIRLGDDFSAFIAVTSTPTENTFQKKKWRYIHEVFSNKQYYHPPLFAINIQLSPPGALQPNDELIIRTIFDIDIRPSTNLLLKAIATFEHHHQQNGPCARAVVKKLETAEPVKSLINDLYSRINISLQVPIAERNQRLWTFVKSNRMLETQRKTKKIRVQSQATNLRALCFCSILVPPLVIDSYLERALNNRPLYELECEALKICGVTLRRSLTGEMVPLLFKNTINVFGLDVIATIIHKIQNSDEVKHIVEDLTDTAGLKLKVCRALDLLQKPTASEFTQSILNEFEIAVQARPQKRLALLDYALLIAGVSSTSMDRILSSRYDDFSSFNRVRCMISARCAGRSSYSEAECVRIAERIWKYVREEASVAAVDLEMGVSRVTAARQRGLRLLGNEVNPVQTAFELVCDKVGIQFEMTNLPSCLRDLGISGRVGNVERVYRLDTEPPQYVKVVSGYRGGYEHKAEELAARGWILRYRRQEGLWTRSDLRLCFVHEGDWNESYLDLMLRSGWDLQVPLEQVVGASRLGVESVLRELTDT